MRSVFVLGVLLLGGGAWGCGGPTEMRDARPDPHLQTLSRWMTGVFSSAEQAEADKDYLAVRMAMARIWSDRTDATWIYVEQAAERALDRPYRQRVYKVTHVGGDVYLSEVFRVAGDATRITGAWEDLAPWREITPQDLERLPGCDVLLRRQPDGTFAGGTLGTQCANTFGDAAYATSEVRVADGLITSWDRGYDQGHAHVWGAEKGPYRFQRIRTLP